MKSKYIQILSNLLTALCILNLIYINKSTSFALNNSNSSKLSLPKIIHKEYLRRVAYFKSKKLEALQATFASDFTWNRLDGSILGKQAYIQMITEGMQMTKSSDIMRFKFNIIQIQNNVVKVSVTEYLKIIYRSSTRKRRHELMSTIWFRETWMNRAEHWKSQKIEELGYKLLLDGKIRQNHPPPSS